MRNTQYQHQCSSKVISHNTSISYKLRQTYLIIDIEPKLDSKQHEDDQISYSFFKDYIPYRQNEDSSISNILIGIGVAAVVLFLLVIIIKLIQMCYKMWREDDNDEKKDQPKKSPLLPSPTSNAVRRNSSLRNPTASTHRSSLSLEIQMELRQKRLSQTFSNTPPLVKKP